MISLTQAVELVWHAFSDCTGGEIYVKKIPSMKLVDIARAIAPEAKHKIVGIRPGEKIHEQMVSTEDARTTVEYPEYYKILPPFFVRSRNARDLNGCNPCPEGFSYASDTNDQWMTTEELQDWLHQKEEK